MATPSSALRRWWTLFALTALAAAGIVVAGISPAAAEPAGSITTSSASVVEGTSADPSARTLMTFTITGYCPTAFVTCEMWTGTSPITAAHGSGDSIGDITAHEVFVTHTTIPPGPFSKTAVVEVFPDAWPEQNETFRMQAGMRSGSVVGLYVNGTPGVGTIVNDDGTPPAGDGTITVVSGNGQRVPQSGQTAPLVVRVTDSSGRPLGGVEVTFRSSGAAGFGWPLPSNTTRGRTAADGTAAAGADASAYPGSFTVVATAAEAGGQATFHGSVIVAADVSAAVTAPRTVAAGTTFTVRVAVTNRGPAPALSLGAVLQLPPGVTLVGAGGGIPQPNRSVFFARPSLASNGTATYVVTVRTAATVRGTGAFTLNAASFVVTDQNPANNRAWAPVTVTAP